jgi:CRISPR-associated endonuclease/helicase Cas3
VSGWVRAVRRRAAVFPIVRKVWAVLRTVMPVTGGDLARCDAAGGPGAALGVLWGKSNAAGRPNLLLQHLLDAAAVGEWVWDTFLAPAVRDVWDVATGGHGREVFVLLCGVHDVGKASPAFQSKSPALAVAVQDAGLTWRQLSRVDAQWHHTIAGARILRQYLPARGWGAESIAWLWPLLAGHHGKVPSAGKLTPPGRGAGHGLGQGWADAQAVLVEAVTGALGLDLSVLARVRPPTRASQLGLLGALVMADWVASDDHNFPGIDDPDRIGLDAARDRASSGWRALGLRGGWNPGRLPCHDDPVEARFGMPARAAQGLVVDLAEGVPAPGLLIVEAPMGEGKTEAALAAAEVLARRFGADGLFVGMPTQATSDPMFGRVRAWAQQVDADVPVALLHGKARFNPEWRELRRSEVRIVGVDEYGCDDVYGSARADGTQQQGQAPAEWFLGNKRGLLTPIVVGTVDHLLHAATRTRHVMLRHAGLAGKVVVLDEVHAYDVYMAQFLHEALRWLAEAGVPVIVLSATLPPDKRAELVGAYLQGATTTRNVDLSGMPASAGYPSALSVTAVDGAPVFDARAGAPWRASVRVGVEVLAEPADGSPDRVVEVLRDRLSAGGCALVVRNTVTRAQQTYLAAREVFGDEAVLLHARLTAGERADRTQRVLSLLGPPGRGGAERPHRLIVVATQLAEQSFDVDADLLVTDLAPIDLLLQRAGRLHRHERPAGQRPGPVRDPRIVVTGMRGGQPGAPRFPKGSSYVYGDHLLLRSAALVTEVVEGGRGWSIPADVPGLVERGYDEASAVPVAWAEAVAAAAEKQRADQELRKARAGQFLLAGPDDLGAPTLAGLHERAVGEADDEDAVAAVVRDGNPSVEVILVCRDDRGYSSLDGRPLGPTGAAVSDPDVLERVVRDCVRLPAREDLTAAALADLRPLSGWASDPWLARSRALVLDDDGRAVLAGWRLTYHHDLGLLTEWNR